MISTNLFASKESYQLLQKITTKNINNKGAMLKITKIILLFFHTKYQLK